MRDLVRSEHGKKDPTIRNLGVELVKYIPKGQMRARISAIWNFVQTNIAYVRDIQDVETLHWPSQVLAQRAGDCDDQAMLVASLLATVGIPSRFKAVAIATVPGGISHVYTQAKLGDKWLAVETTENVPLGWQPPGITDKLIIYN